MSPRSVAHRRQATTKPLVVGRLLVGLRQRSSSGSARRPTTDRMGNGRWRLGSRLGELQFVVVVAILLAAHHRLVLDLPLGQLGVAIALAVLVVPVLVLLIRAVGRTVAI